MTPEDRVAKARLRCNACVGVHLDPCAAQFDSIVKMRFETASRSLCSASGAVETEPDADFRQAFRRRRWREAAEVVTARRGRAPQCHWTRQLER